MTTAVAHTLGSAGDILAGLLARPKRLPCWLLYDDRGAELFERITCLDDYYPTRIELRLLDECLPKIAAEVGPMARVIEPGSGAGIKTKRLVRALERPAGYVGIDVSRTALERTARMLRAEHPALEIHAIAADFTHPFTLPPPGRSTNRALVFFPGSTIGNFEPREAIAFLDRLRRAAGANSRLLLGADGTRDPSVVVRAYDDHEGVTAEFNKNVLAHLNRTQGTAFDLEAFAHRAIWNERCSRIEMHLVARREQRVQLAGHVVVIAAGESIVTEYSYKHELLAMRSIVLAAGWQVRELFTGKEQPMRLWFCESRRG
jgi:dimethylhistidine N-methyltransferase